MKAQDYVPIHVHTIYSDTDSVLRIDKLTDFAKEQGFTALAITDHGTISGWWEFQNACESKGLKPILGIEFYMAPSFNDKSTKRYHVVAYAKNQTGLKNIFELVDFSMHDGFYRKPRITLEQLYEHQEGLVITTACGLGLVALRISEGDQVGAEGLLVDLKDKFGEDLYIELQPHDFHEQKIINPILIKWGKKHDIKTVITTDAHYLLQENVKHHKMLKAICFNQPLESAGFSIDTNFIMLEDELIEYGEAINIPEDVIKESMKNTFEIPDKCEGKLIPYENALPKFEIPSEEEE
jgi:DNA polymerase-3 subunit alpha